MPLKRLHWLLLALVTFFNLRLFLSRWAEEPRTNFQMLVSNPELSSFLVGFAGCVVMLTLLEGLRSRSCTSLLPLLLGCAAAALLVPVLGVSKKIPPLIPTFATIGALCALVCARLRDSVPDSGSQGAELWKSFVLMTLATLNGFLLIAPWTTHVPSYVQDVLDHVPLSSFYFGSVHADVSPVSVALRRVINFFFSRPSINATALSSMLYASVGISLAGVALEMVFGRMWGWALVILTLTDRWLFAGGVSSAVVGQPILSTGGALLLCTWALWRKPLPLSWREALVLGAMNAVGALYIFYSYSAARMTWLAGSGLAAMILLGRRAIGFDLEGLRKAAVAVLPSVAIVALIWGVVFDMDSERFKGQLIVSPEPGRQIKDPNSYRAPVRPVHDPDIPIWWGTGIPTNGEAITLYWRRTPEELLEKVKWFVEAVALEPPISFVLVFLGGLGMILAVASLSRLRRSFAVCLILLSVVSFSTFVLAQDHSAYRRGLATNLLLLCGVVAVFAVKCRPGFSKAFALALCGCLAVLKAPTELNALFDDSFQVPVCASCRPTFDVRDLVNDPSFPPLATRSLRFEMRTGNPQSNYLLCMKNTLNSAEFHELAPKATVLPMRVGELARRFGELASGEVLVVSCFNTSTSDPEVEGACRGAPSDGKLLAMIPSDPKVRGATWWAFVEKP